MRAGTIGRRTRFLVGLWFATVLSAMPTSLKPWSAAGAVAGAARWSVVAFASVSEAGGLPTQQSPPKVAPEKKNPLLKLAQPWPDAEQMQKRKADAEALRLFADTDPIAFTLAADFKALNKDHDPNSTKRYPSELSFGREEGGNDLVQVTLSARGHVRRMARTCDFVPIRVEFPKKQVKETLFARQDVLKLVVQCNNGGEYQQYLLREYLAYRILNLLTPRSFRARLARVTYVDSASGKTIAVRHGMFLEDDGDVAKRMEGRTVNLPRVMFNDLEADALETMMLFEYMIGNTDLSLYQPHNIQLVQTPDRTLYPVPYDFDISGLVHPPYAIPDRRLPIKSVLERLYRGPCRTQGQVDPILANFNAKKDLILALPDRISDMDKASRQDAKSFLESFYSSIKNEKDVRRLFVDGCSKAPTM